MLLVFNSHCDALYRHPWLATGGAIGNALFFIISGYFISAKSQNGNSLKWIFNKIIRLYLPTLFAIIISMLISGSYPPPVTSDIVARFVWPTPFWFIGALILFDILFCILEQFIREHFLSFSFIVGAIYLFCYIVTVDKTNWAVETGYFKWIYCFYTFCLGYKVKLNTKILRTKSAGMLSICTFLMFFVFKLLLQRNLVAMESQFISQIFVVMFAYCALNFCIGAEDRYKAIFHPAVRKGANYWSSCSLEMYLIQFSVIDLCKYINIPILNVLCAFALSTVLAFVYHEVVTKNITKLQLR